MALCAHARLPPLGEFGRRGLLAPLKKGKGTFWWDEGALE